jgi:hypothetical protein
VVAHGVVPANVVLRQPRAQGHSAQERHIGDCETPAVGVWGFTAGDMQGRTCKFVPKA